MATLNIHHIGYSSLNYNVPHLILIGKTKSNEILDHILAIFILLARAMFAIVVCSIGMWRQLLKNQISINDLTESCVPINQVLISFMRRICGYCVTLRF